MSGTYYDYIKANSSSIISGATWNKIVHDGVYVGAAQSGGSADFSAASALAKSKAAAGFELVLYTKTGWVMVNRLITLPRVS
jgi:molybdopterin-containing oxidoreductase family iron-sulfur binding subunit